MKATSWLVLVSLLVIGMVAVAGAQSSEVTHNTWTSGAAMPTPVTFATAAVLKDEIYVLGGENADNTIIADTQIYNPAPTPGALACPIQRGSQRRALQW